MEQVDHSFYISAVDVPKTVKAMQELGQKGGHHHWVSGYEFAKLDNLVDIMDVWRWEVNVAESGNVSGINFRGEKAGDDMTLFKTIAPFVRAGSFIEMTGEDNGHWRYVFDGTTCKEIYPTVSWEE